MGQWLTSNAIVAAKPGTGAGTAVIRGAGGAGLAERRRCVLGAREPCSRLLLYDLNLLSFANTLWQFSAHPRRNLSCLSCWIDEATSVERAKETDPFW